MITITSVSGRRLDDDVARLKKSGLFCVLNHPQADSVLDAAAGIEELAFGDWKIFKSDIQNFNYLPNLHCYSLYIHTVKYICNKVKQSTPCPPPPPIPPRISTTEYPLISVCLHIP
jgi:hypothetical protein